MRQHENFPVASILLRKSVRKQVLAIYRLARLADDLADEPGLEHPIRIACLGELLRGIEASADPEIPGQGSVLAAQGLGELAHRVLAQWRQAVGANPLVVREMRLMLAAFHWDARGFEPLDWEQFDRYGRGSAASVGRMLLALHNCHQDATVAASDGICLALQRINMLQDVARDAARNRVYMPCRVLHAWGLSRDLWLKRCLEGSLGAELAHKLGAEARAQGERLRLHQDLVARLPLRLGLELRAILAGGYNIVRQLEAKPDSAASRPALDRRLSWRFRLRLLGDLIFGLPAGSASSSLTAPVQDHRSPP